MTIHSDQAEVYLKTILEYVLMNTEVFDEIADQIELEPDEFELFLEEVSFTCEDAILEP